MPFTIREFPGTGSAVDGEEVKSTERKRHDAARQVDTSSRQWFEASAAHKQAHYTTSSTDREFIFEKATTTGPMVARQEHPTPTHQQADFSGSHRHSAASQEQQMMSTLQQLVGIISGTIDQKVDNAVQRQPFDEGVEDAIKEQVAEQMDLLLRKIAGSVDEVVRKVCTTEVEARIQREVRPAAGCWCI